MKNTLNIYRVLLMVAVILGIITVSCTEDDKGDEVASYAGRYQLKKATLKTIDIGFKMEVDEDITPMIQDVLLNVSPCNDQLQTIIELRTDQSIYLSCQDEEMSVKAGRWSQNVSDRQLTLIFENADLWQGEPILLNDVTVKGNETTGTSNTVSIEKKWLADLDIPTQVPDIIKVTFSLEMTKQ